MSAVVRLCWLKNRLAAMSLPEILWRVAEKARRRSDRDDARRFIAPLRDYGALPEIPGLRAGIENWQIPEELLRQWEQDAHLAQNGPPRFFGKQWPETSPAPMWHLDPVTGKVWPRDAFCFSIDYRHTGDFGDIKFVWELNRLHYLQPLAALACKRKDSKLANFCLQEIESWIDHNPPFKGVNWGSGIELALRAVSILAVTSLVGEYLSRAARSKIWASLHTHARWIARYKSRYSSANNHRAAEALGIFIIGALCPHFPEAEQWKRIGWDILCDAARKLILPDGAGAEQAVAYAASTLETLLAALKIAQSTNIDVPDDYLRRITLGGEYLRWLCDAKGDTPHIGDDDNACVFGAHREGDLYVASILSCIASVTQRADLSPPLTPPHLRQAIFGFAPPPDFAPYGTRCFPYGGTTIGRHARPRGDILLAFDHGPLGYLSIAAHGHADTLGLWLHVGDQPVFADAGTYLYHGEKDQRHYFRGTAAHNCMTIDNVDSSIQSGSFNWSRKTDGILSAFRSDGDFWQAEAAHDGYLGQYQAICRRRISVSPHSGAVIEDWLQAPAARNVTINFLLHPALTARREGNEIAILKGEEMIVRLRHESNLQSLIGLPETGDGGWYSAEFGVKQPATRLIFRGMLGPDQKAVTHLFWS